MIESKGRDTMAKIIKNMIRCNLCGDTIESVHIHDFVTCRCGGTEYLSRSFVNTSDFTELSIVENDD